MNPNRSRATNTLTSRRQRESMQIHQAGDIQARPDRALARKDDPDYDDSDNFLTERCFGLKGHDRDPRLEGDFSRDDSPLSRSAQRDPALLALS